ncbi:MAG TPA: flagellar basal body protein [Acetobacteraceae bacterium]|nr:flagellar basal body protein [Acetobacteraceae bacterium]
MICGRDGLGLSEQGKAAMDLTSSTLFGLAERRLAWVDQSEKVRAENIANADTPGYTPETMPDFLASLDQAASLPPAPLSPGDIPHPPLPDQLSTDQDEPPSDEATKPDGNGVGTENELGKLADTETMQNLVINLYGAYLGMFRTALDISGGTG